MRQVASGVVALLTAITILFWIQAPEHSSPSLGAQIGTTFDTAVGMIDLYWRHDHRGYERLVHADPTLDGIGGRAARAVALSSDYDDDQRQEAVSRLIHRKGGLDEDFARDLAESLEPDQVSGFDGLDPTLDAELKRVVASDQDR